MKQARILSYHQQPIEITQLCSKIIKRQVDKVEVNPEILAFEIKF